MLTPFPASSASCQRLPARRNVAGDGVHVRGERVRLCGGRGLRPHRGRAGALCAALLAAVAGMHGAEAAQTWRGLVVAPEHRRTPYERGDYPYSQSVEARIVASMCGRAYGPYTGGISPADARRTSSTWWRPPRPTTAGCA